MTLSWDNMDFADEKEVLLEIRGKTPLPVNTVSVRVKNREGDEAASVFDFTGGGGEAQSARIRVPGGLCSVAFVFLPGSRFDFESFRFSRAE